MALSKTKYKQAEVNELIAKAEKELNSKIRELTEENKRLTLEIESFKAREQEISNAIEDAEKHSQKLKQEADAQYAMVMESLSNFSKRWQTFIGLIKQKYPLYKGVGESEKIKEKIDGIILSNAGGKEKIDCVSQTINENLEGAPFNPQAKIREYIAATSDNGFNLQEVLNPGKLELEDLCKELGLIEEN